MRRSFCKCAAYAIGRDTANDDGKAVIEQGRLRALVGGKEAASPLIREGFPTIMGYMYLALQQDDAEDKWLGSTSAYEDAASILKEMKACGYSSRQLPSGQQPSFRCNQFFAWILTS